MHEISDKNFQIVEKCRRPFVLYFGAHWCGPCKIVEPIFQKVAYENVDLAEFGYVVADESPKLAELCNVRGLPSVVVFQGGEPIASKSGAFSESDLIAFIYANI